MDDEDEEIGLLYLLVKIFGDVMKCVVVVNVVLNRFVVGDFLEFLGKEFGLKVLELVVWLVVVDWFGVKEIDGGSLGRSKNDVE